MTEYERYLLKQLATTPVMETLKKDIVGGSFNHAYLFVSTDCELLSHVVTLSSIFAYCKLGGCLECADCRRVLGNNHSDIYHIGTKEQKEIKVDDIRPITEDNGMATMENSHRIYIIEGAERINTVCQNKLLKSLEEPREDTHFFLSTTSPSKLLATVLSRLKQITVPPLTCEQISEALTLLGVEKEISSAVAVYADGNLTEAIRISKDSQYIDKVDYLTEYLYRFDTQADIFELLKNQYFTAQEISSTLDILTEILHNALVSLVSPHATSKMRNNNMLRKIGEKFSVALPELTEAVALAKMKIERNIPQQRIVYALFLRVLEVKNAVSSKN